MGFVQTPPALGNQYADDRVLRSCLARVLPPEMRAAIEPELAELGELAGGRLYRLQLEDRLAEPRLVQWDAWGNRVDAIEVTAVWREAAPLATRLGLVAIPYEGKNGAFARVHQFALLHLFIPATDVYACPLAMTDGAARTLSDSGNRALIERALPRLISRDPARAWTSGQWMTEQAGGSDVGLSETVARRDAEGWKLHGRKWFTSGITSEMALTLARPEGNVAGGKGLALFYLETRGANGLPNAIRVERLKDKLGTRKVPTAELTLEGTPAIPVMGLDNGVRNIAPLLNVTRAWNAISSISYMRRGLALARDYAGKRVAFGAPLAAKPLHVDTLAGLQAEYEAAFQLTFFIAELLGRSESGAASADQAAVLRLLTPVAKLTTARQCVATLSEIVESFGGAGYVEDTGIPALLRDAQVYSIWEGTTNVLSLDVLRALGGPAGIDNLKRETRFLLVGLKEATLVRLSARIEATLEQVERWYRAIAGKDEALLEAGARRFALTLGRTFEAALLARHAQWALDHENDLRSLAAARRFALAGFNLLGDPDSADSRLLMDDR